MAPRLELQQLLEDILGSDAVYFQSPPSIQMQYPCIVYQRNDIRMNYADGKPYKHAVRYQVTVIDPDPDSPIPERISMLPLVEYDRFYTADKLNHNVFNLFF